MQDVDDGGIQLAERAVDADAPQEVLNVRRAGQLVLSIRQHQRSKDDREGGHPHYSPGEAALVMIDLLKSGIPSHPQCRTDCMAMDLALIQQADKLRVSRHLSGPFFAPRDPY